jgi:hypothetical protein
VSGTGLRAEFDAGADVLESEKWVAIRLLHAKSWQVGSITWVLNHAREGGKDPVSTCFPARGLPQSGSKGLSQSVSMFAMPPTPLANAL